MFERLIVGGSRTSVPHLPVSGEGASVGRMLVHHGKMSAVGRVSRVSPVQTALRNCTRDEGGPFGFGRQGLIPSYRKLLWSKAMVVSVAEKLGR
jgi:hypothetical protein